MTNYFDLRGPNHKLLLRSTDQSQLLLRLVGIAAPSTLRPITPAMLIKAYNLLRQGYSITNTVTGRLIDMKP